MAVYTRCCIWMLYNTAKRRNKLGITPALIVLVMVKLNQAVTPSNVTRNAPRTVAQLKQQQAELEAQIAAAALQEVGTYEDATAQLKADFEPLAERFATIKAAYPQAVPPWSTFANRSNIADWLRSKGATDEAMAEATGAIVEGTGISLADVTRLLKNGSDGQRKLFVKVGTDSWYVKA